MKNVLAVAALGVCVTCQPAIADPVSEKQIAISNMQGILGPVEKAASTRTVGARGFITTLSPMYGGFELATSSVVYLLVRGNSLGALGVTQAYLDFPRVSIYNSAGTSLLDVGGFEGFNGCFAAIPNDQLVRSYYAARGAPVQEDDACLAAQFGPGVYTFRVVASVAGSTATFSSIPTAGEILFEVKLGP